MTFMEAVHHDAARPQAGRAGYRVSLLLRGREGLEQSYEATRAWLEARAGAIAVAAFDEAVLSLLEANLGAAAVLAFLELVRAWSSASGHQYFRAAARLAASIGRVAGAPAARDLLAILPWVLEQLRDPDDLALLFAALERLAVTAPGSVALVLRRLPKLLADRSAASLESWLAAGLRVTGNDARKQQAYFSLEDPTAARLLALAGQESDLDRLRRRLEAFVLALWDIRAVLRPLPASGRSSAPGRPAFHGGIVHLPETVAGVRGTAAERLYGAMAAHVGAHLRFSRHRFPLKRLKPLQVALVSLIEDARVETLALRELPGLVRLWMPFHRAQPFDGSTAPALMGRLARALLDPAYVDGDAWICKGRALFWAAADRLEDPQVSREIGGLMGNDLGQMRVQFDERPYVVEPIYRDDNSGLWDFGDMPDAPADATDIVLDSVRIERREDDADRRRDEPEDGEGGANRARARELSGLEGIPVATYPEWDHALALLRPDWTTIIEVPAIPAAEAQCATAPGHEATARRVAALVRTASVGRRARRRRQWEGNILDLDAGITAMISRRAGLTPDPRVYARDVPGPRDLAMLLLLDMSKSTADLDQDGGHVLAAEREAAAVMAGAFEESGDALAIHGFCSDGREKVFYSHVKTFDEPFGRLARARLAGLTSSYSTRLGAAIRHSGTCLARCRAYRRVLLVLTDGEPADIDVPDESYLAEDARRAAQGLRKGGIDIFAFGLGIGPFAQLARIAGARNVFRVPRLEALPGRLMQIYVRLKL